MDLSQLKWLKNVKHKEPDKVWAYNEPQEMPISEAKIFRLHWRSKSQKANAQKPLEGDLIALVQLARVTHVVELLDDVVYENLLDDAVYENVEKEWSIFRVVKAVWMPHEGVNWWSLPHQEETFGVKNLPPDGRVHKVPTDGMLRSQQWKDL